MTLSGPYFCWKKIDFQKIRYKKCTKFLRAHNPNLELFFGLFCLFYIFPLPIFWLPLYFTFSPPFYSRYLFAFDILSGCRKTLGGHYGPSLEMGPWSVVGMLGHFATSFAPKLITFFNLFRQNAVVSKIDCCADRSILALPSAYQEYLVTFKLKTSKVVQTARALIARIWALGSQRATQQK